MRPRDRLLPGALRGERRGRAAPLAGGTGGARAGEMVRTGLGSELTRWRAREPAYGGPGLTRWRVRVAPLPGPGLTGCRPRVVAFRGLRLTPLPAGRAVFPGPRLAVAAPEGSMRWRPAAR